MLVAVMCEHKNSLNFHNFFITTTEKYNLSFYSSIVFARWTTKYLLCLCVCASKTALLFNFYLETLQCVI